ATSNAAVPSGSSGTKLRASLKGNRSTRAVPASPSPGAAGTYSATSPLTTVLSSVRRATSSVTRPSGQRITASLDVTARSPTGSGSSAAVASRATTTVVGWPGTETSTRGSSASTAVNRSVPSPGTLAATAPSSTVTS